MIKWATVRRNECFDLPAMNKNEKYDFYAIAFDPARTGDNSIVGVMGIYKDERDEYVGDIINFMNLIDVGKKKKQQMKSPDQIKYIKKMILDYNGDGRDYENIGEFLIDAGAGGGGISAYSDNLLESWTGYDGRKHDGFLDRNSELYKEEIDNYPNTSNILNLVSPQKYKMQMCEELIKNMHEDAIKFPREYSGRGYVTIEDKKGNIKRVDLDLEEEISLINIDALKAELTAMHAYKSSNGEISKYGLPKDKERTMHDDRWYVLLMLSHYLARLRREEQLKKGRKKRDFNWGDYILF